MIAGRWCGSDRARALHQIRTGAIRGLAVSRFRPPDFRLPHRTPPSVGCGSVLSTVVAGPLWARSAGSLGLTSSGYAISSRGLCARPAASEAPTCGRTGSAINHRKRRHQACLAWNQTGRSELILRFRKKSPPTKPNRETTSPEVGRPRRLNPDSGPSLRRPFRRCHLWTPRTSPARRGIASSLVLSPTKQRLRSCARSPTRPSETFFAL